MRDWKNVRPLPVPEKQSRRQLIDALQQCRAALLQAEPIAEDAIATALEFDVSPDALRKAHKDITDARLTAELVLSLEAGRAKVTG